MNEPLVVVWVGPSAPGRAVADWAAHEARLAGRPLRLVPAAGPEPVRDAALIVLDAGEAGRAPAAADRALVDATACPVVFVPAGLHVEALVRRSRDVTLGLDARRPADEAVGFAFAAARTRRLRLRAVHAWALPPRAAASLFGVPEDSRAAWEDQEVQMLSDTLRPWRARYPDVRVLEDVRLLPPARSLVAACHDSELVVLGRHPGQGSGAPARLLARQARRPVAVVPSPLAGRPGPRSAPSGRHGRESG
ncbi:universal stress protein [Streptomyces fumanus]|uniref:UspA domain-containing protein n=1 Tax=Streptomyces fumanus TaxID=67302 RepID=A0A919B0P0_9ACTN|nr:universal stress protein [Streptomyces fumanus]GHF33590.1 hypothetical protein GCM10018772_69020 [Streptomyces fumanus]